VIRTADTVGYGGKFIHKHGRFIESVTVGTPLALKYLLQPECVNLQEVTTMSPLVNHYWSVRGMPNDFSRYRAMPKNDAELSKFRGQLGYENSNRTVTQIWISLFTQNPGLRRITFSILPGSGKEAARLARAMGNLAQLEEVYIKFIRDWGVLEALLDFCPQVRKITIETFSNKYSNPNQTFRSRDNFNEITDEPKTQVRELDLFSRGRIQRLPWIVPVLWRCPLLESLIIPMHQSQDMFPVVVRAIVEHCPEIRHLYVRIEGKHNSPVTVAALATLLNTGCPRLTSLGLYDAADIFLLERHFMNEGLRQRLEQFVCTSGSRRNDVPGTELVFGVLTVCPNLRVFKAQWMTMNVMEFLEMDVACLGTLETLYLRLRYPKSSLSQVEDAGVQVAEKDEEEERPEAIEANEESKEQADRLYRLHIQSRILDKVAQFTALKKLCLGSHPKEDPFQENVLHLEIGEAEEEKRELLQRFVQMRRLETLKVDGVDYSRRIRRMRC
ncbi:hypothetical protein BGZ95_011461, partial [Linnemannia exigua]